MNFFPSLQSNLIHILLSHFISHSFCAIPYLLQNPTLTNISVRCPSCYLAPQLILSTYAIIPPSPIHSDPFHLYQLTQLCPFPYHPVPDLIPPLIPPSFYPTIWSCPFPYLLYFPPHSFLSNT